MPTVEAFDDHDWGTWREATETQYIITEVPYTGLSAATYLTLHRLILRGDDMSELFGCRFYDVWGPANTYIEGPTTSSENRGASLGWMDVLVRDSGWTVSPRIEILYNGSATNSGKNADTIVLNLDDLGEDDTDWFYKEQVGFVTASGISNLVSQSVPMTQGHDYLVIGAFRCSVGSTSVSFGGDLYCTSTSQLIGTSACGGDNQGYFNREGEDTSEEVRVLMMGVFTASVTASHTLAVRGYAGAANKFTLAEARIFVIDLAKFDEYAFDGPDSEASPSGQTELSTLGTYTPSTTADHLVLGYASGTNTGGDNTADSQVEYDDTTGDWVETNGIKHYDDTDISGIPWAHIVELDTGGTDIDLDVWGTTGYSWENGWLVAISLGGGDTTRAAYVSWAELELPNAARQAYVSWAEVEVPTAARQAYVSWAEIEIPTAARQAYVSWAELEIPETTTRRALISWAELELPDAARQAWVSWAEVELPDAAREAHVSWAELELPDAARAAYLSWAEVEMPDAARAAYISWTELELPDAPRAAYVSWAELELPDAARQAWVSWAELELPVEARMAYLSWAELELGYAARMAYVSWAELEVPTAAREAHVSWAEFEIPTAPRAAYISWAEVELPDAARQAWVSWAELEIPDIPPRAAYISWVEFEVPDVGRAAFISWAELEIPTAPRAAFVSWAELELPDAARQAWVSWAEMELPDPARQAWVSWTELELPTAARQALVSWTEFEVPVAARQALVSWAEVELPDAAREAQVSWAELEIPTAARQAWISWTEYEIPDANPRAAYVSWTVFEIQEEIPAKDTSHIMLMGIGR